MSTKKAANAGKRAAKKAVTSPTRPYLLFIDANILLDFYRSRNDAGISLVSKIDLLHSRIITSCQIEMEFKKNRQKVISESFNALKTPEINLTTPAFLNQAASVGVINRHSRDIKVRIGKLQKRILKALENPTSHDKIYQTAQRLFNQESELNLRQDDAEYKIIWRKALRRFLEGRPPRKKDDTSAGDSINWEWIISCAKKKNADVIVVSRDADYGLTIKDLVVANNWLEEEFKERVSKKRRLILTDRLSEAFKLVNVRVTIEEAASERATIAAGRRKSKYATKLEDAVDNSIEQLLEEEEVNSAIAETNAYGWEVSTYQLQNIEKTNGVISGELVFYLSGEQDEDKSWFGDSISGQCVVRLDADGILEYTEIGASVDREDGPDFCGELDES